MKKTKQLKRNIIDFTDIDLSKVYEIVELNGLNSSAQNIVKLSIDTLTKLSYSEDFESLTGLKV